MSTLPTDPLQNYLTDRRPENLKPVMASLAPTINYALTSIGAQNDPVMRAKALTVTAKAVQDFDPGQGAALPTFVSSQLRSLGRENRKRRAILPIPEREQLDKLAITRFSEAFVDKHGREPTVAEMSEGTRLTPKRIGKMFDAQRSLGTERSPESGEDVGYTTKNTDWNEEAVEYVYGDSDRIDQRILEATMGLYGKPVVDGTALGKELKLQPYQLSRRRMRLTKKVLDIAKDLESLQS
jgi:hypothetical protein